MQKIKNELKQKNENPEQLKDDKIRFLESTKTSEAVIKQDSNQLSKNLANSLMNLIDKVNEQEVTPESVNASCNAAAQIYKILRLNYDMKKEGF